MLDKRSVVVAQSDVDTFHLLLRMVPHNVTDISIEKTPPPHPSEIADKILTGSLRLSNKLADFLLA
jgi:hypothetical protein